MPLWFLRYGFVAIIKNCFPKKGHKNGSFKYNLTKGNGGGGLPDMV
jgi:hypothetical protein